MRRSSRAEQAQAAEADSIKYQRPKILLLDCAPEVEAALTGAGYNAKSGTFGRPYRVRLGSGYLPVLSKASLPNYPEQEVVIIDLGEGEPRR
jgi:hypothetical protein